MNDREVERSGKGEGDEVVALSGAFGVVESVTAVTHIEGGMEYFVVRDGVRHRVGVVHGPNGKYLRCSWDGTGRNNLLDLPDSGWNAEG